MSSGGLTPRKFTFDIRVRRDCWKRQIVVKDGQGTSSSTSPAPSWIGWCGDLPAHPCSNRRAMKWIVGLDLRPRSHGAVQFARWLSQEARAGGDRFALVHVLEDEHLRVVLRSHHLDEVVAAAKAAASGILARERLSGLDGEPEVVQGLWADEALAEACTAGKGDAVVVGRAAARESHRLVRLGRVARGLLHDLACPVVVVPPDLEPGDLGPGPVVALSNLADDSVEACRFAGRLAERLGRPLTVLHVVPLHDVHDLPYLPEESLARLSAEQQAEAGAHLAAWLARHGLPGEPVVAQGQLTERAASFALERKAPILVVGSRRLSTVGRALHVSAGSELAATAPLPVAVVPPRG